MNARRPFDHRLHARHTHGGGGFTLIEVVFAIVLSALVSAVLAAALITALRATKSTTSVVGDSSDTALISAFLIRDGQSSGGIDPTTGQLDTNLGVSKVDWGSCTPPTPAPVLLFRFAWVEYSSPTVSTKIVVTYSLDSTQALTRRICKGSAAPVDVVLGRHVTSAVATCQRGSQLDAPCADQPTSVSLAVKGTTVIVNGSGAATPFSTTLTASIRSGGSQLTISGPANLPGGQINVSYSSTVITSGATAPAAWTATGLPPGLTITMTSDTKSATVAGTPTTAGTFTVTVKVTDTVTSALRTYAITIAAASAGTCQTTPNDNGVRTVPSVTPADGYFGEDRVEFSNPSLPITSMTLTIKVAQTAGVIYNGQYETFEGGNVSKTISTTGGFIVYTTTLNPGKNLAPYQSKRVAAQWNGNGPIHPTTGDTWCVTTTTTQGTKTDGGNFPAAAP